MLRVLQLFAEAGHITSEQLLHALVDVRVFVADAAHQLADDLWIGLPIEAMIGRSRVAEDLDQRAMDGAAPRAVAQEERTIDVEENEPGGARRACRRAKVGRGHDLVRRSPVMIDAAPATSQPVIPSPRTSQATARANTGCRFEYIAVRVGPRTRTP